MYVRLAFAVAAHLEPEILIADEVLAVGDTAFQKKCLAKMASIAREGRTVLFVSHNLSAVSSLCNRTMSFQNGVRTADGATSKIISYYLELSEAAIIAATRPGEYDLRQHTNNYGEKLHVLGLRLLGADGRPKDSFAMGESLTAEVEVQDIHLFEDAMVGITFKTGEDRWLASLNTGMSCSAIERPRTIRERATMKVRRLPFLPGTYWLAISVSRERSYRTDYVERAAAITVVPADVYGTDYPMAPHLGVVFLEGEWTISSSD
jgi:lipopolysaccharide transport system ATP-binding protein